MGGKLIHAVTISDSLFFMRGQLRYLTEQGYEVKALSSSGNNVEEFERKEGVQVLRLDMEREISLFKDLKALIKCIYIIWKEKPDVVNASTPKAGLVVTLASYVCGVPVRIYNIRGLRMETTVGIKRRILLSAEKIAAKAATHCLAVSESLKDQIVEFGIAEKEKIFVLGKGSGEGFTIERFQKDDMMQTLIDEKKKEYGLTSQHTVLGFTGRMTKDKGIKELVEVFLKLRERHSNLRLLIVGDYESSDAVSEEIQQEIRDNPSIIHTGYQDHPIPFYYLMDIFAFFTKREGFGNVAIEAALTGLPVIASNVTGAKNTILDGETGFLVDPDNLKDTVKKVELLVQSPDLRAQLGNNGKKWASDNFKSEFLWKELGEYYRNCLGEEPAMIEHIDETV